MFPTLTEIQASLRAAGIKPKKRYGQHFLHDQNQMAKLLAAAELKPNEQVLEVGAGTGALSVRILEESVKLLTVEIDRSLEPLLREVLGPYDDAKLLITDALASKHVIHPAVTRLLHGRPFKLVANLPYSIASPLLANLAMDCSTMTAAVFTIQQEVAQRLAAKPGGKSYGPLGVLIQSLCTVELIGRVPASCFWPQPEVDSAIVRLCRREVPLTGDPKRLAALLQRLFQKRRKQLGSILGYTQTLPEGIDASSRPEQLPVEQLVALSRIFHHEDHAGT